jgi:hypothetical protein
MGNSHSEKKHKNSHFDKAEVITLPAVDQHPTSSASILSSPAITSEVISQVLEEREAKSPEEARRQLIKVYQKIQLDSDFYLNLDTLRKNKSSALVRKEPRYIDHRLRIFSSQEKIFNQAILIISQLNQKTEPDVRGSIISYVEGSIEFHDLITTSIKVFNSGEKPPPKIQNIYQTIHSKSPLLAIKDQRKRISRALISPADRQILATPRDETEAIPSATRKLVWNREFGSMGNSKCYSCHSPLDHGNWHCGHILSRKEGGRIEKENLRPVCVKCNMGMGVNHMYEYMIVNRLPGRLLLDPSDPIVIMMEQVSTLIFCSWSKIETLKEAGYLTATEAKTYREMIVSAKKTLSERMAIMINISQYEERVPSLLNN